MSKIVWDALGQHLYETGVDHGVLYPTLNGQYQKGVAWNGLTSVSESPDGGDATDFWADNIKYASVRAAENYKGSIEAYTYPDEFEACDGSASLVAGLVIGQQARAPFSLCYRTYIGSDTSPASEATYKLHLVYNCTVSPSEKTHETVNDSPDAVTMSWDFESTPVNVTNHKPCCSLTIDSTKVQAQKLKAVEDKLFGTESTEPELLMPDAILALLQ